MKKKREKLITESLELCLHLRVQGSGFCYGEMIIRKDGFEPRSNRRAVSSKSSVIFFFLITVSVHTVTAVHWCHLLPGLGLSLPGSLRASPELGVAKVQHRLEKLYNSLLMP